MLTISTLFLKQTGTTENVVPAPIINGVAERNVVGDRDYDIYFRAGTKFEDSLDEVSINERYVIDDPTRTKMSDKKQTIHVPASPGNIDLTWKKLTNYRHPYYFNEWLNCIAQNRANGHVTNYDTVDVFDFDYLDDSGSLNNEYSASCMVDINKIALISQTRVDILNTDTMTIDINDSIKFVTYGGKNSKTVMIDKNLIRCSIYLLDLETKEFKQVPNNNNNNNNNVPSTCLADKNLIQGNAGGIYNLSDCYNGNIIKTLSNDGESGIPIIMPDNRTLVKMFKGYQQSVKIYLEDLFTDEKTTILTSCSEEFLPRPAMCILDNDRIIHGAGINFLVFNVRDGSWVKIPRSVISGGSWYNTMGVLLNDGRVMFEPWGDRQISIVDPDNLSHIALNYPEPNPYAYSSSYILPNGKIVMTHNYHSIIYKNKTLVISASDGNYGALPSDPEVLLSPFINYMHLNYFWG